MCSRWGQRGGRGAGLPRSHPWPNPACHRKALGGRAAGPAGPRATAARQAGSRARPCGTRGRFTTGLPRPASACASRPPCTHPGPVCPAPCEHKPNSPRLPGPERSCRDRAPCMHPCMLPEQRQHGTPLLPSSSRPLPRASLRCVVTERRNPRGRAPRGLAASAWPGRLRPGRPPLSLLVVSPGPLPGPAPAASTTLTRTSPSTMTSSQQRAAV